MYKIQLHTLRSNNTPLPEIFCRFHYLHKIKNINKLLISASHQDVVLLYRQTDRHTYVRKSQAPYGINFITNSIKLPEFARKILEGEKNPTYMLISLPFHSLHNKDSKL